MVRRRRITHRLSNRTARLKPASILLLAMLALSGCSLLPREDVVLQPPLVEPAREELDLVAVGRGSIKTFLKGNATFESSNVKALSFKDGGQLKSINVTLGQEVKAGELLGELETGDLDLQLGLQRLSVERTQLLYGQARTNDASATEIRLKEIDMEREKMSLAAMESRLDKARLYAPITGTVIFIEQVKTGERVNAYQPIITVADSNSMRLTYTAANSKDVLPVEAGMPVRLKYKGKDYAGKVLQSPSNVPAGADPSKAEKNAVTIMIGMDNPPAGIQIGHSAEITIELQKRENAIVLPRSALRSYMGRFYVQVSEGELRKEVDVEVGLTTPTEVEIVKGLKEGDKVIVNQ
ncbi:efflux RND transporter periplasmic adaptor subunit [Paenibacillus methanolicus]|uniref:RND family efflux transporter MFP subunit n=1 Tax=Paenibacillus methanolicus TaxID=582686 RepID=A0A5S5CBS7_9BACL|nr:efflux RND transporter periplasmic adaptor subunit [Paenibacillus methanolicus]TYP76831.1 RND family efflux transporter MFP subunit [Paenibacillus methanolicus]